MVLYLPSFVALAYLLQLLWPFKIFYRNPTSAIFKIAAIPANFNFQTGSIAENVFYDIYYYSAKVHAFTSFLGNLESFRL